MHDLHIINYHENFVTLPMKAADPPSLAMEHATLAGAPPGALRNPWDSANETPAVSGTKSINISPKHTMFVEAAIFFYNENVSTRWMIIRLYEGRRMYIMIYIEEAREIRVLMGIYVGEMEKSCWLMDFRIDQWNVILTLYLWLNILINLNFFIWILKLVKHILILSSYLFLIWIIFLRSYMRFYIYLHFLSINLSYM